MAYRFKLHEPCDEGVKRIALQQIDRALQQIQAGSVKTVRTRRKKGEASDVGHQPSLAIHDVRKRLKRLRALLRLVRSGVGDKVYAAENARFREIARLLSPAREQHVMLETINALEVLAAGRTRLAFTAARRKLAQVVPVPSGEDFLAQAVEGLVEARAVMAVLEIDARGFEPVFEGLERVYRQAVHGRDHAYDTENDEAFHDFRKRVQYHWRHMILLTAAWPETMKVRIESASQLSQMLGEEHDISVMRAALSGEGQITLTPNQRWFCGETPNRAAGAGSAARAAHVCGDAARVYRAYPPILANRRSGWVAVTLITRPFGCVRTGCVLLRPTVTFWR